jgi:hypothetical protein
MQVEKPKNKEKWSYLQKYWHKGAFFQVGPELLAW